MICIYGCSCKKKYKVVLTRFLYCQQRLHRWFYSPIGNKKCGKCHFDIFHRHNKKMETTRKNNNTYNNV